MFLFAHSENGFGWGGPFEPWEIHPVLNHFAIAFLLAGVALDVYAWWRNRPELAQVAAGLLIAGLLTGVLTALAGLLAFFTVPGHTPEAHRLMYWHMAIQAGSLLMFAWPVWRRWRKWPAPPTQGARFLSCVAIVLLLVGSGIGGYLVYHGGAGIDPTLLNPAIRSGHHHENSPQEASHLIRREQSNHGPNGSGSN